MHSITMNKRALILRTAILFTFGLTALTGCGSSATKQTANSNEHSEGEEHEHHRVETGVDPAHGEHDHAKGEHMNHMAEVRELLKKELGAEYNEPIPLATKEQLLLGKEIYARTCAACHGIGGEGDGPVAAALPTKPSSFTDPEHSTYYSEQGRLYIIKKGVEGTLMVGWEKALNEEEIQAVYAYVRSLRSTEVREEHHHEHEENREGQHH